MKCSQAGLGPSGDPTLGAAVQCGQPTTFAGYSNSDFAYIGFGASQDIPYPGKRQLRTMSPNTKPTPWKRKPIQPAERWWEISKMVYFRLAYIQQTLGVLQRSDALLTQVQEASEARYRVGQGNQQDVLRVQLQPHEDSSRDRTPPSGRRTA